MAMSRLRVTISMCLAATLGAAALAVAAPSASAQTYSDVPTSHWAYKYIKSVTDRGPTGHKLLDDFGTAFKPESAITRAHLARTLVLASGHYGEKVTPVAINDVAPGYRYYNVIQVALHYRYMTLDASGNFSPTGTVPAYKAEASIVRWLKERYSSAATWTLLYSLKPGRWQPNEGWKTGAPTYLPYVIASRQLQLRFDHGPGSDGHECIPGKAIDRAEIAYMMWRGYRVGSEYLLSGLANFSSITFPTLSDRQKQVARYALKYIGYPYVWGGEYPTKDSPYGTQKSGGFDCSGFVFYVMKMHFGYPITVNERGASAMAAKAKPRITRANLKCGDLIFFGPDGPSSAASTIYHAGLYLGNGWFIHSTGSSDGVTLASLDTSSYYKERFAWGRRLLTSTELSLTGTAALAAEGTSTITTVEVAATPSATATTAAEVAPTPSATPVGD